jgi:hypothetical protein
VLPKSPCLKRKGARFVLRNPPGATIVKAELRIKQGKAITRNGRRYKLRRLPGGRFVISVRITVADGRSATVKRRYRACG